MMKAHGKSWVHWSMQVDGAVIRTGKAERETLLSADPDRARARLIRDRRDLAPKRWLKARDAEQMGDGHG